MDKEISVIDLSENEMNMVGNHDSKIKASDSKSQKIAIQTVNTPSDHSKVRKLENSKPDGLYRNSNINDSVNSSTTETKLEGATDDEINTGSNTPHYLNGLMILGMIVVCVFPLSVITLIPRNNSLFHPDTWYERRSSLFLYTQPYCR